MKAGTRAHGGTPMDEATGSANVTVGAGLQSYDLHPASDFSSLVRRLQQRTPICLDLSECERFDVVALLHVLAIVAKRSEHDLATRFRLPKDTAARDFLRKKSFPSAVGHVAQVPFRFLVDRKDLRYFGETLGSTTKVVAVDATKAIIEYLSDKRFFGFRPYRLQSPFDRGPLMESEWLHWRNPLIMRVLEKRLGADPRDFNRVVVTELLAGLLRHVSSGTVITASQIGATDAGRFLTIAAWQGATSPPANLCQRFLSLVATDSDRNPGRFELTTTPSAPVKQPDPVLLKTPAVSRRPAAPSCEAATSATLTPAALAELAVLAGDSGPARSKSGGHRTSDTTPGASSHSGAVELGPSSLESGIRAFYQSVIDVFDGQMTVSCDNFSMKLAGTNSATAPKYRASVSIANRHEFPGTIIAARVPLSHG